MSEPDDLPTDLMSRKDAAAYVRQRWGRPCTSPMLAKAAVRGDGPAFRKIGTRWVVYAKADLDRWVLSAMSEPVYSTAEAAKASGKAA
jgi:hypothetical protein